MSRADESVNSTPRTIAPLLFVLLGMWIVTVPALAQEASDEPAIPNLPFLLGLHTELTGNADAGLVRAGENVWIDQGMIPGVLDENGSLAGGTDLEDLGRILNEMQDRSAKDLEILAQLQADPEAMRLVYFASLASEIQAMMQVELVLPDFAFSFDPNAMIVGNPDFHNVPAGLAGSGPAAAGDTTWQGPADGSGSAAYCGGDGQLVCDHPVWREQLRNASGMLVRGEAHRSAVDQADGTLYVLAEDVQSRYLSGAQVCDLSETSLAVLAPWAQQPVLGTCGGVLVEHPKHGPGFLTARHCAVNGSGASLESFLQIGDGAHLVFDFISENVTAPRSEGFMSRRSVTLAPDAAVIIPEDPSIDLALIPVARDRLPDGVEILQLGNPNVLVSVGTEIFSYSFPLGTPMKAVAGPENVVTVIREDRMLVTLDNFRKSSGSPVFSIDGQLIGIFSRTDNTDGDTDFELFGDCFSPRQFDLTGQPEPWLPTVVSVANLALPTIRIAGTVVSKP